VNDAVNVAGTLAFTVCVADEPVPPFTGVNTNEGAGVKPEPPFKIVTSATDAGMIEQVILGYYWPLSLLLIQLK
jgi:hypothetical protein